MTAKPVNQQRLGAFVLFLCLNDRDDRSTSHRIRETPQSCHLGANMRKANQSAGSGHQPNQKLRLHLKKYDIFLGIFTLCLACGVQQEQQYVCGLTWIYTCFLWRYTTQTIPRLIWNRQIQYEWWPIHVRPSAVGTAVHQVTSARCDPVTSAARKIWPLVCSSGFDRTNSSREVVASWTPGATFVASSCFVATCPPTDRNGLQLIASWLHPPK